MEAPRNFDDYETLLRSSIDILGECTAVEALIEDQNSSKRSLAEYSASLDAFTLSLVENYAKYLDAQIGAIDASLASESLQRECQSRHDLAEDSDNSIEAIKRIYNPPLRRKITQHRQNVERDLILSSFASYCEALLLKRNREAPSVSKELCRILLEAYRNQNGNDDEILDVSDSLSAPVCVLSKEILKNPVAGPCRHYFSEEVIKTSIAQSSSSSIDCPSAGCSQKLTERNLERDYFKDLEISLWQQKEGVRRQEASINMTHV